MKKTLGYVVNFRGHVMYSLNKTIGKNLSRIRKDRELSLDGLAELTGVSKSMLRQIERGESSPTVSTLWKIATNLQLPFSVLINEPQRLVTVVDKKGLMPISDNPKHYKLYTLFPFEPSKKFEIFSMELEPGSIKSSDAHNQGVEEYIMVSKGTLTLGIGQDRYHLSEGSAIHFSADQPHALENPTDSPTEIIVIINYDQA